MRPRSSTFDCSLASSSPRRSTTSGHAKQSCERSFARITSGSQLAKKGPTRFAFSPWLPSQGRKAGASTSAGGSVAGGGSAARKAKRRCGSRCHSGAGTEVEALGFSGGPCHSRGVRGRDRGPERGPSALPRCGRRPAAHWSVSGSTVGGGASPGLPQERRHPLARHPELLGDRVHSPALAV